VAALVPVARPPAAPAVPSVPPGLGAVPAAAPVLGAPADGITQRDVRWIAQPEGAEPALGYMRGISEVHARDIGLPAPEYRAGQLTARPESGPLIASVSFQFPDDGRRGGHLVVLRGYELDQADPLILFRDPSGWGQQHDRVALSRLASSYIGRCITFTPLAAALAGSGRACGRRS
jgi:hypothetical protein